MDLKFSVVEQHRVTAPLAEGLVSLDDRFSSAKGLRGYEQHAPGPENRAAEVDRRHGTLSLSGDEPFFTLFRSESHQGAPYTTVVADVMGVAGSSLVCVKVYHIEEFHYWRHTANFVRLWDLFIGLGKAVVFGGA